MMLPLLRVHHGALELLHARQCDLNAPGRGGAVTVRPKIAANQIAQKIPPQQFLKFYSRDEAITGFEFQVLLGMISSGPGGIGLLDIAPAVAGLGADMVGKKIAPLGIHLEMRVRIAGGPDDLIKLGTAPESEPLGHQLPLGVIFRLALLHLALLAQLFDPFRYWIVVAVGDRFAYAPDIGHKSSSSIFARFALEPRI